MTSGEVDRIMAAVEAVRAEVKGLRIDFNSRVRTLELNWARMEGRWSATGGFWTKLIVGVSLFTALGATAAAWIK